MVLAPVVLALLLVTTIRVLTSLDGQVLVRICILYMHVYMYEEMTSESLID